MLPGGLELAPTPVALAHWSAAILCVAVVFVLNLIERDLRAIKALNHFACLVALWNTARALQLSAVEPLAAAFLSDVRLIIEAITVAAALEFTHVMVWGRLVRRRWLWAAQLGALLAGLLVIFTPWLVDGVQPAPWGFEARYGPLGPVYLLAIGACAWISWRDLLTLRRRSLPGTAERHRLNWMIPPFVAVCLVAIDIGAPYLLLLNIPMVPVGPVMTAVMILGVGVLAWRHRVLALDATVAAEPLMQHAEQGVLVVDEDGVIRAANPSARRLLGGHEASDIEGQAVAALLGLRRPLDEIAQRIDDRPDRAPELVILQHADGPEQALLLNVICRPTGKAMAYVCLLRPAMTQTGRRKQAGHAANFYDGLTGLPGRAMFLSQMHTRLDRSQDPSEGRPIAVWVLAVHRMRVINEDLGFAVGDRVLVEVARRLQATVGEQGLFARMGGDEFAVALRVDDDAAAQAISQALRAAMAQPVAARDHALHLRVALGLAVGHDESTSALLRRAIAQAGNDGHLTDTPAPRPDAPPMNRTRQEDQLRRAIQAGELRPYYQPIIDTTAGRIAGFEALVRWVRPGHTQPVLPGEFVPLAEEVGLMGDIDATMVEQAAAHLAALQKVTGRADLFVSVNLDSSKLRDRELDRWMHGLVQRHGLPKGTLKLEILERAAVNDSLRGKLAALDRAGIGLSIDDFGTGQSSLSRLREVPAQILKIDRSFVGAMNEAGGFKLLSGIVALAHGLELTTLAEGVETPEQVGRLQAMGCTLAQGFLFSRAVPLMEAQALLANAQWVQQRLRAA